MKVLLKTFKYLQKNKLKTNYLLSTLNRYYTENKSKLYYVSTPIYYVNAEPHIGHLYSTLLADTLARWKRLTSNSEYHVLFSTGTDEHGLKIQQAAKKANLKENIFCDNVSNKFKTLFEDSNISFTRFIRTTDVKHIETAQNLWRIINDAGYIYRGSYEGWYCTSDEAFLQESDCVKDNSGNMVSKESGHSVEWIKEDNYMFKLSEFRKPLLKWIDEEKPIMPSQFEPIIKSWLTSSELPDLSVSRSTKRLQWGIPIPGDQDQKMYVWMDALANYLTAAGHGGDTFEWPPDCQVIGKDILKFHAIYWPAFLMAAGLKLPKKILTHSHWTIDGKKMSKSVGNVVNPKTLIDRYGTDSVRYFLLRQGVPHSDNDFSESRLVQTVNDELVNTLCNLLSRCCSSTLNPDLRITQYDSRFVDEDLIHELSKLSDIVNEHYSRGNIYRVAEVTMSYLKKVNAFLQNREPWKLRKVNPRCEQADSVVSFCLLSVQITSLLLQPVVPEISQIILDKLSVPEDRRYFDCCTEHHLLVEKERALGNQSNIILSRIKS